MCCLTTLQPCRTCLEPVVDAARAWSLWLVPRRCKRCTCKAHAAPVSEMACTVPPRKCSVCLSIQPHDGSLALLLSTSSGRLRCSTRKAHTCMHAHDVSGRPSMKAVQPMRILAVPMFQDPGRQVRGRMGVKWALCWPHQPNSIGGHHATALPLRVCIMQCMPSPAHHFLGGKVSLHHVLNLSQAGSRPPSASLSEMVCRGHRQTRQDSASVKAAAPDDHA